jgi:hypothetical protein
MKAATESTTQTTFTMNDFTGLYAAKAERLRETASKLDSWCQKLTDLKIGELVVMEYTYSQAPLRMGFYDGVGNQNGEPFIRLRSPTYISIEDEKTNKFSLRDGAGIELHFTDMVSDVIRGATLSDIYVEFEANAALAKYGLSAEKVRRDLLG